MSKRLMRNITQKHDGIQNINKYRRYNIAMVCDCFYPNVGGVESHIFQLSQCLLQLGHKVIVISHSYGDEKDRRQGVRYMLGGLKVYYIPWKTFYNQVIFITVLGTLPIIRDILIREDIEIVHGHSAFSTLAHESLIHASSMGLKTVFTDHSLFGFADLSSIAANKTLQFTLCTIDKVICVSFTSKENTVLRATLDPHSVFVIPNAINASEFMPDVSARDKKKINVVVISRLVYRKGADLLAAVIPPLCNTFPELNFIIAGDGPKLLSLEEVRERYQLHSRIQLLGSIPHHKVHSILIKGDIFLNTSLTEAFCIAIVEAASCGLRVISTAVGGVKEVLPSHLLYLSPVSASELASKLAEVISVVREEKFSLSFEDMKKQAFERHEEVKMFYCWHKVAKRTEKVYDEALAYPSKSFPERLNRYYTVCGPVCGKVLSIVIFFHWILLHIMSFIRPSRSISKVPFIKDFDL